ncbi:putative uncharacterized protein [Eubacterium sp. CAG:274]|nr:putative uncharacterized protein [Eubacterium sp. CAG:274]
MIIRHSSKNDIPKMLEIYETARAFMRSTGNMEQWINGYPSKEVLEKDIENNESYICEKDGEIVGTFVYNIGIDKTYNKIYEGQWLNNKPYGYIHRIAGDGKTKGVGSFCINWAFEKCGNMKIDTHADNKPMQNLLLKLGFKKCGIIYIADGSQRVAFQKEKKVIR